MLATWWRRIRPEVGWTPFWLVTLVVLSAAWSTVRADWADGLTILPGIALGGLLVGLVLASWRRLPSWGAHATMVVAGSGLILWRMTRLLSDDLGGWWDKLAFLWSRWVEWFTAIRQGERAEDLYLFILLMAAVHYLIAYTAAWLVLRRRHAWVSVLLPGIVVLTNLGYSRKVSTGYLVLYLLAAILLVGRVHLANREWSWRRLGIPYSGLIAWRAMWVLTYLAVAVLIAGWIVPLRIHSQQAAAAWDQVNDPWERARTTLAQWFPSVRGPGAGGGVGGFASFGSAFQLGGPLRLSDTPVVLVTGPSAPYLVAHRYNIFTGQGWQTDLDPANEADAQATPRDPRFINGPLVELQEGESLPSMAWSSQSRIEQRFTVAVLQPRSAVIFTTGQPVSVSEPVRVQMSWFDTGGTVIDVQEVELDAVPPELRGLVELLKTADFTPPPEPTPTPVPTGTADATEETTTASTPGPTPTPTARPQGTRYGTPPELPEIRRQLRELRRRGIEASYYIDAQNGYRVSQLWYRGPLPVYDDVEALFAEDAVRQGYTYQMVGSLSAATPGELRQAGQISAQLLGETDPTRLDQPVVVTEYGIYPEPIYARYTQLPPVVSQRTVDLARSLAEGKTNAYDIAAEIEAFLRSHIAYNENIAQPRTQDIVDYLLFERPEGYCTYYATAMIVLLRILDIPSRMVVGYYPAGFDEQSGGYLYRDSNAHAWVEVYFPGYGWVPFEPTAARAPIQRGIVPGVEGLSGDPDAGGVPSGLPTDSRFFEFPEEFAPEAAGGIGAVGAPPERSTPQWLVAARGLALVLILLVAGALVAWFWGTRGLTEVGQLMLKVQRASRLAGLPYEPTMTPYELANVVAAALPGTRHHAWLIADLYTRERYGGYQPSPAERARARRAWKELRGRFLRHALSARWKVEPAAEAASQ